MVPRAISISLIVRIAGKSRCKPWLPYASYYQRNFSKRCRFQLEILTAQTSTSRRKIPTKQLEKEYDPFVPLTGCRLHNVLSSRRAKYAILTV